MAPECPLVCLPVGLRLQIYEHVLLDLPCNDNPDGTLSEYPPVCCRLIVRSSNGTVYSDIKGEHKETLRRFTALLQICRLINEEAKDLLYELFSFKIGLDTRPGLPGACRWQSWSPSYHRLGPIAECSLLRKIQSVYIAVNISEYEEMFSIHSTLEILFQHMTCTRSNTTVQLQIWAECALHTVKVPPNEDQWKAFVEGMSALSRCCRFHLCHGWLRDKRRPRMEQLIDAIDGYVCLCFD